MLSPNCSSLIVESFLDFLPSSSVQAYLLDSIWLFFLSSWPPDLGQEDSLLLLLFLTWLHVPFLLLVITLPA